MSDDERDLDVDSDADKRAHHNALERQRRDHIKNSFSSLRDAVPALQGEKDAAGQNAAKQKASRAQILNKATDYIQYMRRKNQTHQQDIDDLKKQNALLDQQVRALEKARATGNLSSALLNDASSLGLKTRSGSDSSDSDDTHTHTQGQRKRLKTDNKKS
ncbi:protein max-like isoform X6 [Branchiostoma floridae]|uniref:Protein max n=1 Tax=Branchiostoma floridae TaxID=7739 RepID=A0A9J7MS22_BRAFL|nr:protein max-like isoform X6 [Branchiostoma floridae]